MNGSRGGDDARVKVARYRVDRLEAELDDRGDDAGEPRRADASQDDPTRVESEPSGDAGTPGMQERAQYVEMALQQAMRRGDFDNLPGAGKPLDLGSGTHDPDWWIRRKIERENLTGLGPPALTLRTENAALEEKLDALVSERAVREALTEFNARVVEARRQLLGGPPVVTPTRDVDSEVLKWSERRASLERAAEAERRREAEAFAALSWRERRRVRRSTSPWNR